VPAGALSRGVAPAGDDAAAADHDAAAGGPDGAEVDGGADAGAWPGTDGDCGELAGGAPVAAAGSLDGVSGGGAASGFDPWDGAAA
jgi:hypothetical protein